MEDDHEEESMSHREADYPITILRTGEKEEPGKNVE